MIHAREASTGQHANELPQEDARFLFPNSWAYYTDAHGPVETRPPGGYGSKERNETPYKSVWEGRGLCPRGDGGRGGDAIA